MSNPINAFGIIKRTHKESLEKLNLESSNSIINLQKANRSLMEFINDAPAVEDFYAATESIALIQVRKYVSTVLIITYLSQFRKKNPCSTHFLHESICIEVVCLISKYL